MPWTPPTTYTDDVSTWGAADVMALGNSLSSHTDSTVSPIAGRIGEVEFNVQVRSLWNFLAPITSPTPAQTLTAIHAGLAWSADTGGELLIPDSVEPWVVSSTIIPPPNSRMTGPIAARFFERQSRSGHGTNFWQLPATGKALGGAWIKLADNANCPILASDYTNAVGKRGPDRGNNAYWQWFFAFGITFDHNGRNQAATTANGIGDVANASPTISNATGSWSPGDIIVHANIPAGTYVKTVVGSTLTLTANATGTATGASLSEGVIAVDIRHAWGMNFAYCNLMAPRGRGWSFYRCNDCNGEKVHAAGDIDEIANGIGDSTIGLSTVLNASGSWAVGDLITALPGFPYGTYVQAVAGSTLTLYTAGSPTVATSTAIGMSLTRPTMMADHLLAMVNTTTDCEWLGCSMHGSRQSTLLIDTARGMALDGLWGFAVGGAGHNVWLRNSFAGDCINNRVTGRCDSASGHNVRIDATCKSNETDLTCFSPGLYGRAADADGGWVNVYCDGTHNDIGGVGTKGWGAASNISNLGAFGPNSSFNQGRLGGGHDLAASTPLWRLPSNAPSTNRVLGQSVFLKSAEEFSARSGAPAMVTVNTDERVMSFANAATEVAVASFVVPDGIRGVILRPMLMSLNSAVAAGDVRLNLGLTAIIPGGAQVLGADTTLLAGTVTIPASYAHVVTSFSPGGLYSVVPGAFISLRFKRLGSDALDTYTGGIGLIGLRVEPLLMSS